MSLLYDDDSWDDPDDWDDSPEPPEDYLIAEAGRRARIHRDQEHDGGECDCPVAEPDYAEEAPF